MRRVQRSRRSYATVGYIKPRVVEASCSCSYRTRVEVGSVTLRSVRAKSCGQFFMVYLWRVTGGLPVRDRTGGGGGGGREGERRAKGVEASNSYAASGDLPEEVARRLDLDRHPRSSAFATCADW